MRGADTRGKEPDVSPEQRWRLHEIFETAVSLDEDSCRLYLAMTCGGDEALRAELESLLRSHRKPGPFLDAPAVILVSDQNGATEEPELIGRRIGRYELTRIIAHGGMGIVYEAMQDDPRRVVAVKVMRRGLTARSSLRRFREEAKILARLRHPNIAQIFDAGMHIEESVRDGGEPIPYFAMEYVRDARPIIEYARTMHLTVRERLALFTKVCDAVHHGHQRGIIHRDIKPANILVDVAGEPRIIDFGVARSTDSDVALTSQATDHKQIVGTVQYMSPEQCEGDPQELDSRSDVYSLGVVLYELLSGVPAVNVENTTLIHAMKRIREESPPPLSSFDRAFRGDLETIVNRAMEKDRTARYQSAEALRYDIERHLSDEPISARPQSAWVRVTRWMGRHPVVTTGAAAGGVAFVILATTLLAVAYGLSRPARFWVSPDRDVAHLVTAFGRPLATFGGEGSNRDAVKVSLVERPRDFGGGEVALFYVRSGQRSTEQQLWVCKTNNLNLPLWTTSPQTPDSIPDLPIDVPSAALNRSFVVTDFWTADVFTQSPGEEIIVIHEQSGESPHAIRVYDMTGAILFEFWHFGRVSQIFWWKEAGLLVGAGERQLREDVSRFGYECPPWPRVVFAVRPRLGERVGWLNEPHWPSEWRQTPGSDETLAWYRVFEPVELAQYFGADAIRKEPPLIGGAARIAVSYSSLRYGGFSFVIDADAKVDHFHPTDDFQQVRSVVSIPDPELNEWPPHRPSQ